MRRVEQPDLLIRDVPEDVIAALEAHARRLGLSRATIARCVSLLARHPWAAEADLILGMDAAHPAYPYTGWLREPLAIDSEPARRSWRERQEKADEARRRAARRQERSAGLMAALDDARPRLNAASGSPRPEP